MSREPRIDAYIAKSAEFARPILRQVREVVHRALPEVEEGIKWGVPHFMLAGKNVAGMAAFKQHAAIMLAAEDRAGGGMGSYGKLRSLADVPPEAELTARLHHARDLVAAGKSPAAAARKGEPKPELPVPQDLAAALRDNPCAQETFDGFPPSARRDYLEWITGAKQDATRAKRLATAIEWLAEGKKRNWKYEKC